MGEEVYVFNFSNPQKREINPQGLEGKIHAKNIWRQVSPQIQYSQPLTSDFPNTKPISHDARARRRADTESL